jgi:hypothetical protein
LINFSSRVFLIDHAWTYKTQEARKNLTEHEQLLDRMCKLMNIDLSDEEDVNDAEEFKKRKVESVINNMWKYNQTYKLSTNLLVTIILKKSFKLEISLKNDIYAE